MDPVLGDAKRRSEAMRTMAKMIHEHAVIHHRPGTAGRKMAEQDYETAKASADLLDKLATEVARLRLGIGHAYHGRMSMTDLDRMTRTWNASKG